MRTDPIPNLVVNAKHFCQNSGHELSCRRIEQGLEAIFIQPTPPLESPNRRLRSVVCLMPKPALLLTSEPSDSFVARRMLCRTDWLNRTA